MPTLIEGLGAEEVVEETYLVLREKLNDAISRQEERREAFDRMRAQRLGVEYVAVEVERVPADNFHVGSIPSFVGVDDRTGAYPLVAVVPGRTVPDAENAIIDHYNAYNNAVAIHCFSRAPGTDEANVELAHRRRERMAEAVHSVVHHDPSLRHLIAGVSGPVLVDRSEPWFFPHEDGHGEDWCWMAVMHQYQIKNYSRMPEEV